METDGVKSLLAIPRQKAFPVYPLQINYSTWKFPRSERAAQTISRTAYKNSIGKSVNKAALKYAAKDGAIIGGVIGTGISATMLVKRRRKKNVRK